MPVSNELRKELIVCHACVGISFTQTARMMKPYREVTDLASVGFPNKYMFFVKVVRITVAENFTMLSGILCTCGLSQ